MKYSLEVPPEKTARAIGYELDISPRHAIEIARAIKGMRLEKAKKYLQEVIDLKRPIPYKRCQQAGHKKGIGPGKYPKKASMKILKLLESAENNAEYKGLEPEDMRILHIATHRGRVIKKNIPKAHGRSTPYNTETTNVELIIEEV